MWTYITKLVKIAITLLHIHGFKMHTSLINSDRSSRFHASRSNAKTGDTFGEMVHRRFCTATAFHHFTTDMHQSIEESSCGNDYAFGFEFCTPNGSYAHSFTLFNEQFVGLVLPNVQIFSRIKCCSPCPNKLLSVALCTGTPHSRAFSDIQHAKLYGCFVSDKSHISAQSIDLSYDLSLGNSTHSGIATHLSYLVHIHCYQTSFSAHVG